MVTAYFTLCSTHKKVVLLEADKIAHGATGHNAGQVVAYFEKPFSEIVSEYGLQKAGEAQKAIVSAWELLEDIYDNAALQTPLHRFTGYAGCSSQEQVMQHLENKYLRHKVGLNIEEIFIASSVPWVKDIPERYKGLYSTIDHGGILSLLETHNTQYIAVLSIEKGVVNSALFTEGLVSFLLSHFADRFSLYEESPITNIKLDRDKASVVAGDHGVKAESVVLCTNGFHSFDLESVNGFDINTRFHEEVHGVVGYMAGYTEPLDKPPTAISYFNNVSNRPDVPYFYLTRRPYELEQNKRHNLVCIGGPEVTIPHKKHYQKDIVFEEKIIAAINTFLKETYKPFPPDPVTYQFHWHGLMGYTKNRLRLVGKEPCNGHLLYNLGCNGVGILPSIYGAKRISQLLKGEKLKSSVFDPVDTRCMIK